MQSMKVRVYLYDEKVVLTLPPTFPIFKNLVGHYYHLTEEEINAFDFFIKVQNSKTPLSNDQEYEALLKSNNFLASIIMEVNEKSTVFLKEEPKPQEGLNKINDFIFSEAEKLKTMINNQGEMVMELWNNHSGKIMDMWNNLNVVEQVKEQYDHVYQKVQENIQYFNAPQKEMEEIEAQILEEPKKIIHPRVSCDCCRKFPIEGTRFKCTVCDNFDYCESCEEKYGLEHNHPFLKIRKPELAPIQIQCHVNH